MKKEILNLQKEIIDLDKNDLFIAYMISTQRALVAINVSLGMVCILMVLSFFI